MSFEELSSVGWFPSSTVGAPGTHGAGVTGMHGMGVSTPKAAAVAAATSGLETVVHMPNGMMFTIGMWSMMLASGTWSVNVLFMGSTTSELGAAPKLHIITAPMQTCIAICELLQLFFDFFLF
jgi:hypothetical protein